MKIEQFYDDNLAHASYIITSNNEAAVIDPARDPYPYLDYLAKNEAQLKVIIETHPHADFVSSHLELHKKTNAKIYVGKLVGVFYPHTGVEDGDEVILGNIKLKFLLTPGHSPDSISVLVFDEENNPYALLSGDTLFVGDVGRPDLRESAGNISKKREELAGAMFETVQNKLKILNDEILVYPAHGAGSLCGKALSKERFSTIGNEKRFNYAFQINEKSEFIDSLLQDQPFIPSYFGYDVELNRKGAPDFYESINSIPKYNSDFEIPENSIIIDVRERKEFRKKHIDNSINIFKDTKFETWLGTLVKPEEKFYIICESENEFDEILKRTAKIGYEANVLGIMTLPKYANFTSDELNLEHFRQNTESYTIIDVRNPSETVNGLKFGHAIPIPLSDLRIKLDLIPEDKPVVMHCAGGYRSAIAMSIVENKINNKVYDLGEEIKSY